MHLIIVFAFMMEANLENKQTILPERTVAEVSIQQKRMRRKLLQSIQGGTSQLPPVMIAKNQSNGLYEV